MLERAITILSKRGLLSDWYNQIPVASGLINDRADRRAAIDLLRHRENQAAFVELKWASDTPVFAAIEILLYGLVFVFSMVHRNQLDYRERPLLGVNEVALEVLAPSEFYNGYELSQLRQSLDQAAREFSSQKTDGALAMGFEFHSFPSEFQLPFANGVQVLQLENCDSNAPICESTISATEHIAQVQ